MSGLKTEHHPLHKVNRVLIVSHKGEAYALTGSLLEYIRKRFEQVDVIFHPLWGTSVVKSSRLRYVDGVLSEEHYFYCVVTRLNMLISYSVTFWLTIVWAVMSKEKYQLFIGVNNLNALAGLILQKLGLVKRVVFYTADYAERRYDDHLSNYLYHWIDQISATKSDWVWNVSQRICQVRREQGVAKNRNLHVSNGVHLNKIKPFDTNKFSRKNIVYVGVLIRSKGVQHAIHAIADLVRSDGEVTLFIIGSGSYENQLKELVSEERLDSNVKFMGLLSNEEVLSFLSQSGVGLAFYTPDDEFNVYCDPLKVKEYLACGCPVVITDVPEIASVVEQMQLGIVINDQVELTGAIRTLVNDDKVYYRYRENAQKFASDFDWDDIYNRAFTRMGF